MLAALGDGLGDLLRRNGDDREVDGRRYVAHRAVGGHPVHFLQVLGEGLVHGVQPPGEARLAEVAEDAPADTARAAAGADDGHGTGRQQPPHGVRLGALFPRTLHGDGALGGFEAELQVYDAVLEAALLGVPGVREHLDHLVVGGEHLGREAADAPLARHGRDVLEQRGGDAPALVGVLDEERDLGLVGGRRGGHPVGTNAVIAYGGDELAADRGRESHPVHKVVVREAVDVLVGQARVGREEPVVLRLVRNLLVEADQALGVIDGDGADARGAAVAQHHVGLPVGGVLVPVRRALHGAQSTARVRQRREAVCGGRSSDRGRDPTTTSGGDRRPLPHTLHVWNTGLDNLNTEGQHHMAERRVNVGWAEGLHARPASIFVRAATAAGIPVTIAKADGNPVNAASMLAVLGLGAQGGEEIVLASEADGADVALDRLAKLVAEGLEELPETV